MKFFVLSPEVAGDLGDNTTMSRVTHPPTVSHLHYEMDGWLGDDLLESFPCFVITSRLAAALRAAHLSGFELRNVEMSTSEQFRKIYPGRDIPSFSWLFVVGHAGTDDFGLTLRGRLVASQKAMDVLKTMQINNCDISTLS